MAELKCRLWGHELKNPIMPAAGPNCVDGEMLIAASRGGAGGLVMKTISVEPAKIPYPNIKRVNKETLMNAELWSEYPYQQYLDKEYELAKSTGQFLMASIGYNAEELSFLGPLVEKTGYVDAIEFSVHYVGKDYTTVVENAKALKESVSLPVLVKVSPGFPDIPAFVKAIESYVDGFIAINSVGPGLDFDPVTLRPLMGSEHGYGYVSGRAIFPIALQIVHEISLNTDKPIIGVGGIYSGLEAIKMMMAGASAVQVCSIVIEEGHSAYARIAKEMSDWLDKNGYADVNEIVGLYSKKSNKAVMQRPGMSIDADKCIRCGKCIKTCLHHGLSTGEKLLPVFNENCIQCGFCQSICPVKAIKMN